MDKKKESKKHIKLFYNYIKLHHIYEVITPIIIFVFFIVSVLIIIAFARGYRIDFQKQTISSTGILAISSTPKAAKVFINGDFKGVTELNMSMQPGNYRIEIKKDGFAPYTKTVQLKGELVEAIDPILFPINPSLTPITNLGIVKAVPVGQSDNLLLFSDTENEEKDAIYLFETIKKSISIFPPLKIIALKNQLPLDSSLIKTQLDFSSDYKQVILDVYTKDDIPKGSFLISLDAEKQIPLDVTLSKQTLIKIWEDERSKEMKKILETFPKEIRKIATDTFSMATYSPDGSKVLYRASREQILPFARKSPLIASNQTPEQRQVKINHIYVYDKKEDKNFYIADDKTILDTIRWYMDSKRLAYQEQHQFSISLYDGDSKQLVYSGPFESSFYSINSLGKLLILTNLNPLLNPFPDVYEVGIR